MASLSIYYKPIVTHLSDDTDSGRTLCGIAIPDDWECSGFVWEDEPGAVCGCMRCQRILEKRIEAESIKQAKP